MNKERVVLLGTPFVALTAVGAGLRIGAPDVTRWAVVYGASESRAGTGSALQVVASQEDGRGLSPLSMTRLSMIATTGDGRTVEWNGETNVDGVGEALLPLPTLRGTHIEVRAGGALLAGGEAMQDAGHPAGPSYPAWMPFARREGEIRLDVALVGQSASPGFPSTICVRSTHRATGAASVDTLIEAEQDPSWNAAVPIGRTDSEGWAELTLTTVGLAVSLALHAHARDGRSGAWVGGLYASPGGARLDTRLRWTPDEEPRIDVVTPGPRATEYIEIDDAYGRAWAAAVTPAGPPTTWPAASVRVPRLAPGLYWAVAASDPTTPSKLGPRATVRPFFVAWSDDSALAFGTDPAGCASRRDARETQAALWPCLALSPATPVARYTVLDGFPAIVRATRARRSRGLTIAMGAIALATLIEMALMLRAAAATRARFAVDATDVAGAPEHTVVRWCSIGIAVLLGLLGFVLLAALIMRAS